MGKNLALGDLMGMIQVLSCCKSHILSVACRIEAWVCLQAFFEKLGLHEIRFKPTYNPYTEPSMEIFHWHHGTALTQSALLLLVPSPLICCGCDTLAAFIQASTSGWRSATRACFVLRCSAPWASLRRAPVSLPSFAQHIRCSHLLDPPEIDCLAAQDVSCIAWGLSLERPTMILYGIDNIRDLFGHKVTHDHLQIWHATSEEAVLGLLIHCVCGEQVDLGMIKTNPICRLVK